MQSEGGGDDTRPKADVVAHLKLEEVTKDVCVDKVEGIDADGDDNHQLIGLVIGVVQAVDVAGRVSFVATEVGGSVMVDTIEILVLEHLHALVVVVNEIAHTGEGSIDDGDLPCLVVVHLPCAGKQG